QLPYATRQSVTEKEYRVIKGPEDAVQAVKEHVNNSVDVIKIVAFGERMGLSTAEMKAIVNTAHDHGLKVTAHSTGGKSLADAIDAGVDGIEHAYYLHDTLLTKMAKRGIYMVPTDPSFNSIIKTQESMQQTKHDTTAIRSELKPLSDRLVRARKAGVMIVAGSDAYFELAGSRGDAAKETIAAYVEEGLSVEEALQAATINAAKAIGQKDQLGAIKVGAKADIVIFNGNLKTVFSTALFDVNMVIKGGKIIYSRN
ncbi:MAG TPA: amidohydrolase family protein, partial [Chitinophaga sp.]|nr:amidohydrolase family protein [Chitinophaga sp.]